MTAFIVKLLLGMALFALAKYVRNIKLEGRRGEEVAPPWAPLLAWLTRAFAALMFIWAVLGTSAVWVRSGEIVALKRIYFGKALPPGKIIATDGELGPQAEVLTAGFKLIPFVTLINEIDREPVFTVPPGQCAILSARDGVPIPNGGAFAEPWPAGTADRMANDAVYFLRNGGQRGPQATVLRPGSYTLNPYLWEKPKLIDSTRVEQGTVGVVKSSVHARVDFGSFTREKPENMTPKLLGSTPPEGAAKINIVATGGIGVWEEPLLPNVYYVNTDAYKVTHVPVTAQVFEFKGGYTRRTIELTVDEKTGAISQKETVREVQDVPEAADRAIMVKPEGWDVAQESRVIAQITPNDAPLAVAALGITGENALRVIDDRVITPVMRSVQRDVLGGKQIRIQTQRVVTDEKSVPILTNGVPLTTAVTEFRQVKVLDLLENRSSLEQAVEELARPEARKEFVTILEVRLAESAVPPELLVPRKREQLAQQIKKAWQEEEIAQAQRQTTENARAQADQQDELVKAKIAKQSAELIAEATFTKADGERRALEALAQGQSAQMKVLGDEATVKLRMFELALKTLQDLVEKKPEIVTAGLANASKFVPNVVVNSAGGSNGSGSMEGAMAVLGHFLNPGAASGTPLKGLGIPAATNSVPQNK